MINLTRLSIIFVFLATVCPANPAPAKLSPTPIEVWSGGDDALTIKLRDALENTFKTSADFRASSGKKLGTLIVTIPSNVNWQNVGRHTRILYIVEFTSSDNRKLGVSKGSCLDNEIEKCAMQVVKDARIVVRKN